MPNAFLDRLRRQREQVQTEIEEITARATGEERDLTDEETVSVQDRAELLGPLDARIRQMTGLEESRINYLEDARRLDGRGGQESYSEALTGEVTHPGQEQPDYRSWGQRFTESSIPGEYQARGHGRSEGLSVGSATSAMALRQDAAAAPGERAIASADGLGALVPIHLLPGPIPPPSLPNMLSLVRRSATRGQVIQYVKEVLPTTPTPPPGVTPEGQPKPQWDLTFEPETATVGTIAQWVIAMRQILDDLPQLRAYIDGRLRDRLIRAIELFVLTGDTSVGNPGIIAGAQTVVASDLFDAVLGGAEAVEALGYEPTGVVINGRDWFSFIRWLVDRPTALGDMVITSTLPYRVMGLPVVVTPSLAQGQVLVGDFVNGCELFDREQTQILVADQHADIFIRNQIVVLAEARLALAVYAPQAFAVSTVTRAAGQSGGQAPAGAQTPPQPQQRPQPTTGSHRR